MFSGCDSLKKLDVSGFDTGNVTDMRYMFYHCGSLTELDVSHFDTGNVTDMRGMFEDCGNLTELDVSRFDTGNVTNMSYIFRNCQNLGAIYVGNYFVTDQITEDQAVFADCFHLKGGAGTFFDAGHIDKTYAHIDGGASDPGYFTWKD